ncbi:VP2 [Halorubrum pleomorphic virus 11]|uniref:VP2 n=2 Tax=Betapleolipovirus TaxID=1911605 RepID=A0A410N6W6_9VIRU|nr:VP2 [Halorubrum pleomorphic virus 12]YP_009819964.1 VP2 [Halorubrum pleomorphic virus 11]QAS68805.1 VP2 [Halorubrum pleomorphic virus 12]QAS68902.1 VP2 [Halorubrum pleomorphic virus 11]
MAKMQMDAIDASLFVLNTMAGFLLVGIGTFELFGVDFGATLFSPAGIGLSTAWVIGYAAVVGTLITNDNAELSSLSNDIQDLEGYYYAAAAGTLLLPIAFVVFPDTVGSFFKSADLWGLSYVVLVTSGQAALGWML